MLKRVWALRGGGSVFVLIAIIWHFLLLLLPLPMLLRAIALTESISVKCNDRTPIAELFLSSIRDNLRNFRSVFLNFFPQANSNEPWLSMIYNFLGVAYSRFEVMDEFSHFFELAHRSRK